MRLYGSAMAAVVAAAFLVSASPVAAASPSPCVGEMVSATGLSLYNGRVAFDVERTADGYRMVDCVRGIVAFDAGGTIDLERAVIVTSDDAVFDSEKERAAVSAYWAAQQLYDFYYGSFGWKGWSGKGAALALYVHYGKNYFNASFDRGSVVFGDGGAYNSTPIISVDYVGHEVTHGVTLSSARLFYSGESGALNESFSDIIGKAFQHALLPERRDDWDMFADIYRDPGMSTRSLSAPDSFAVPRGPGASAAIAERARAGEKTVFQTMARTYLGKGWNFEDSSGEALYTNAGPHNFAFYLLSAGGNGVNDFGRAYRVEGIGTEKAAAIFFRALTVYLTPESDYLDARYAAEQAAIDLHGQGSREYGSVVAAFDAIEATEENYRRVPRPARQVDAILLTDPAAPGGGFNAAGGADFPAPAGVAKAHDAWLLHSSSIVYSYDEFRSWQNWSVAGGHAYEIRFTPRGGEAFFVNEQDGDAGVRGVPFEVWELGRNLDDPADDVRYIPVVYDIDANGTYGIFGRDRSGSGYSKDHPALAGGDDAWTDMIHIAAPRDLSPGESGYRAAIGGAKDARGPNHLQWLAFIRPTGERKGETRPPEGATYRIVLSRETLTGAKQRPVPVPLAAAPR